MEIKKILDQVAVSQRQHRDAMKRLTSLPTHSTERVQNTDRAANSFDAEMSREEFELYNVCAKRLDLVFTSLYQTAWTRLYETDQEKQNLILTYVRSIIKIGGFAEARKIMRFLDSPHNDLYVRFAPTPMEFMYLKKRIPQEMQKGNFKLPKISEITLKGRVHSGLTKMLAGASIEKSHSDILDLVRYNYEKYILHQQKFGIPLPGSKSYNYYEIDLTGGR